jgi:hypothetical protein
VDVTDLNDRGDDELIVGYVPTFRHVQDWQQVFRQQHATPAGSVVRRVIWEQEANRRCRLLVDVAECRTSSDARSRLKEIALDSNFQFAPGPDRLGPGALVHPEGTPRSAYLIRANLMIWVLSCGRAYFDVLSCADRIVADLTPSAAPEADEDLVLTREPETPDAPGAICLSAAPRWERGEWAWFKFTAQSGTLARAMEGDGLVLWPAPGQREVSVRGWVIEPGRKTYRGQYIHKS